MSDDDDNEEQEEQVEICKRCGDHPDDLKCLDEFIGDELRPIQTKLSKFINDEAIPHKVRGEIVESVDSLGRAMQAAKDYTDKKILKFH